MRKPETTPHKYRVMLAARSARCFRTAQLAQLAQEHFKKLEQERFEADLKQAQEAIAHMGTRLHTLESGNHDGLVVELDEDFLCAPFALGRVDNQA